MPLLCVSSPNRLFVSGAWFIQTLIAKIKPSQSRSYNHGQNRRLVETPSTNRRDVSEIHYRFQNQDRWVLRRGGRGLAERVRRPLPPRLGGADTRRHQAQQFPRLSGDSDSASGEEDDEESCRLSALERWIGRNLASSISDRNSKPLAMTATKQILNELKNLQKNPDI